VSWGLQVPCRHANERTPFTCSVKSWANLPNARDGFPFLQMPKTYTLSPSSPAMVQSDSAGNSTAISSGGKGQTEPFDSGNGTTPGMPSRGGDGSNSTASIAAKYRPVIKAISVFLNVTPSKPGAQLRPNFWAPRMVGKFYSVKSGLSRRSCSDRAIGIMVAAKADTDASYWSSQTGHSTSRKALKLPFG
jgi:hypothetical protein